MLKHLYIGLMGMVALCSCHGNQSGEPASSDSTMVETFEDNHKVMLLFGHTISLDSASIDDELAALANDIDEIEYDVEKGNITLCDVTFHVNADQRSLAFMTSVQPDSPKMEEVRNLISMYYGKVSNEDDLVYTWPYVMDEAGRSNHNPYIKMRRVHSDEGGTFIFFD